MTVSKPLPQALMVTEPLTAGTKVNQTPLASGPQAGTGSPVEVEALVFMLKAMAFVSAMAPAQVSLAGCACASRGTAIRAAINAIILPASITASVVFVLLVNLLIVRSSLTNLLLI